MLTFRKRRAVSCVFFAEWCAFFERLQSVQVAPKVKVDQELMRKQSRTFSER